MEGTTLIVCARSENEKRLQALVHDTPYRACTFARSASQARRLLSNDLYPLIVVDAPLADERGVRLSAELAATTMAAVILLAPHGLVPLVGDAAAEAGVLLVSKPVDPKLFEQALYFALSGRNRLTVLKNENQRLQKLLENQKLVDRAKCLLIEHFRMSEDDAHRLIEKKAMDERAPRVRIARRIIAQYEL